LTGRFNQEICGSERGRICSAKDGWDGKVAYPSVEEKAAIMLYFIVGYVEQPLWLSDGIRFRQ
jgi:hypothetical protein